MKRLHSLVLLFYSHMAFTLAYHKPPSTYVPPTVAPTPSSHGSNCFMGNAPVCGTNGYENFLFDNPCDFNDFNGKQLMARQKALLKTNLPECYPSPSAPYPKPYTYCPQFCNPIFNPVCGSYLNVQRNFTNECELRKYACQTKQNWQIVLNGTCVDASCPLDGQQVCAWYNYQKYNFPNLISLYNDIKLTGRNWQILNVGPCPCDTQYKPVCAQVDCATTTFRNKCFLKQAIQNATYWKILFYGECPMMPLTGTNPCNINNVVTNSPNIPPVITTPIPIIPTLPTVPTNVTTPNATGGNQTAGISITATNNQISAGSNNNNVNLTIATLIAQLNITATDLTAATTAPPTATAATPIASCNVSNPIVIPIPSLNMRPVYVVRQNQIVPYTPISYSPGYSSNIPPIYSSSVNTNTPSGVAYGATYNKYGNSYASSTMPPYNTGGYNAPAVHNTPQTGGNAGGATTQSPNSGAPNTYNNGPTPPYTPGSYSGYSAYNTGQNSANTGSISSQSNSGYYVPNSSNNASYVPSAPSGYDSSYAISTLPPYAGGGYTGPVAYNIPQTGGNTGSMPTQSPNGGSNTHGNGPIPPYAPGSYSGSSVYNSLQTSTNTGSVSSQTNNGYYVPNNVPINASSVQSGYGNSYASSTVSPYAGGGYNGPVVYNTPPTGGNTGPIPTLSPISGVSNTYGYGPMPPFTSGSYSGSLSYNSPQTSANTGSMSSQTNNGYYVPSSMNNTSYRATTGSYGSPPVQSSVQPIYYAPRTALRNGHVQPSNSKYAYGYNIPPSTTPTPTTTNSPGYGANPGYYGNPPFNAGMYNGPPVLNSTTSTSNTGYVQTNNNYYSSGYKAANTVPNPYSTNDIPKTSSYTSSSGGNSVTYTSSNYNSNSAINCSSYTPTNSNSYAYPPPATTPQPSICGNTKPSQSTGYKIVKSTATRSKSLSTAYSSTRTQYPAPSLIYRIKILSNYQPAPSRSYSGSASSNSANGNCKTCVSDDDEDDDGAEDDGSRKGYYDSFT